MYMTILQWHLVIVRIAVRDSEGEREARNLRWKDLCYGHDLIINQAHNFMCVPMCTWAGEFAPRSYDYSYRLHCWLHRFSERWHIERERGGGGGWLVTRTPNGNFVPHVRSQTRILYRIRYIMERQRYWNVSNRRNLPYGFGKGTLLTLMEKNIKKSFMLQLEIFF